MKTNDMAFFHEGALHICGSLDINEVLQNCLVFLQRFMPLNAIVFALLESDASEVRAIARAADFKIKHPLNAPIALSEESRAYFRSHTGKVIIVDSSVNTSLAGKFAGVLGLRRFNGMGMPLRIKGEEVGFIAVLSISAKRFSSEHVRLLELLHDPFAIAMSNHLRYREVLRLQEMLSDDNRYLHQELHRISGDEIVGEKFGLRTVMEMVCQVAPLDSHVILMGETGVGKEIVANAIHYSSQRRDFPFIKVNCGAIPEGLLDSELFGHEKGAFTGALAMSRGRFERADRGTIFLDEVGELPLAAQVRLLRVLQDKQIERVGGGRSIPVNVRIISATNRDLRLMVKRGQFREDLWYRLNVFPITIPPLRQRKADIPAFVYYFIERKIREMNLQFRPVVARGCLERLQQYNWPGNVRELENAVERELIRNQTRNFKEPLRFDDIHPLSSGETPASLAECTNLDCDALDLDSVERIHITRVLEITGGKVQGQKGAAALLGMNSSTLRHRMRKLGILFGRQRQKGIF